MENKKIREHLQQTEESVQVTEVQSLDNLPSVEGNAGVRTHSINGIEMYLGASCLGDSQDYGYKY
jgi:hypothetical protein